MPQSESRKIKSRVFYHKLKCSVNRDYQLFCRNHVVVLNLHEFLVILKAQFLNGGIEMILFDASFFEKLVLSFCF